MGCGCTSTCGCQFLAGPGILIKQLGDKFTISNTAPAIASLGVPVFLQEGDPIADYPTLTKYIWFQVDNLGNLIQVKYENGL